MVEVPDASVWKLEMDLTSVGEVQTAQNTVVRKFKCTPKKKCVLLRLDDVIRGKLISIDLY